MLIIVNSKMYIECISYSVELLEYLDYVFWNFVFAEDINKIVLSLINIVAAKMIFYVSKSSHFAFNVLYSDSR